MDIYSTLLGASFVTLIVLFGIVFWPMLGFGESEPVDLEDDSDTDYEVL